MALGFSDWLAKGRRTRYSPASKKRMRGRGEVPAKRDRKTNSQIPLGNTERLLAAGV